MRSHSMSMSAQLNRHVRRPFLCRASMDLRDGELQNQMLRPSESFCSIGHCLTETRSQMACCKAEVDLQTSTSQPDHMLGHAWLSFHLKLYTCKKLLEIRKASKLPPSELHFRLPTINFHPRSGPKRAYFFLKQPGPEANKDPALQVLSLVPLLPSGIVPPPLGSPLIKLN